MIEHVRIVARHVEQAVGVRDESRDVVGRHDDGVGVDAGREHVASALAIPLKPFNGRRHRQREHGLVRSLIRDSTRVVVILHVDRAVRRPHEAHVHVDLVRVARGGDRFSSMILLLDCNSPPFCADRSLLVSIT